MTGNARDRGVAAGTTLRGRCPVALDNKIRCELAPGHTGRHSNGLLVWHEPPLILIDGQPPDVTTETEHWQDGRVRFGWEQTA